ncbi:MAG: M16 family metallopeptidase [Acidimicrobiales bacterium]
MSPEPELRTTTLANGVRIVTEAMPGTRSAAVGCWVGVGNRDESTELAGASHFLEHLLFKGSPHWGARELAEAIDRTGGDLNAFTTKEYTAYHARVPDTEIDLAIDVLTDVIRRPAFGTVEVDSERQVILEELLLSEDLPEDIAATVMHQALFPQHPLGWEVLGTHQSIADMTADAIGGFHAHWYRPANLVFAAAGHIDHDQLVAGVEAVFGDLDTGPRPRRSAPEVFTEQPRLVERPGEQTHLAIGWRGLGHGDPDRYAMAVANQVIGGGLSSRLFQEVRERRGLVYSIFSTSGAYADSGTFSIHAGTANTRAVELLEVVDHEIAALVADGITEAELDVARAGFEGATLLGLEDSSSRMMRLATGLTVRDRVTPVEESLAAIRAVTVDDVHRVLQRVLGRPRVLSAAGAVERLAA